jgi:UDP-N-acetylenolpyruvoylglucosamine reductase
MMKFLLYGFLIYLLYKIIFDVVVPVRKGVKTVRQNMEEMQRKMAESQQFQGTNTGFSNQNNPKTPPKTANKPIEKDADYIDFEEVK